MVLFMLCRAVVVECCFLKPCWNVFVGMFCVMYGRMIFSSVLAMGESREMGLYDVPMFGSLFGFGMGHIVAIFQMSGMMFELSASLNISVRCFIAVCPRCFRCLMLIPSGPHELFVLLCCIAFEVCAGVMSMYVWVSFRIFLSIFLFCLDVLCVTVDVNCLLKWLAVCLGVTAVLLPN